MSKEVVCAYCSDVIEGEGIQRGSRVYCCEACAFEGTRSVDCAGRSDASQASLEEEMEYRANPPIS